MTNKQLLMSVLVIILLVVVIGGVIIIRNRDIAEDNFPSPQELKNDYDGNIGKLVVTHAFDGTEHEYTGSVVLPSPCHSLETTFAVAESFPEQITINLTTTEPDKNFVCTAVLERATFDIFIPASRGAKLMRVVLDGTPIDFEIFEEFKG